MTLISQTSFHSHHTVAASSGPIENVRLKKLVLAKDGAIDVNEWEWWVLGVCGEYKGWDCGIPMWLTYLEKACAPSYMVGEGCMGECPRGDDCFSDGVVLLEVQ